MRVRLTAGAIFVAVLGATAALAPSASAESTPSAFGSRLVTLINDARAQHGLRALTVTSGTSTVASNWTAHMAAQQGLMHNPNLASQLETHGSPNWTTYSENVGLGDASSADSMFTAYMNSPEHRANILDSSVRYVGVGVAFTGTDAWNTLDFVDQYSSTTTSTTSTKTTTTTTKTTTTTTKTTTQAPRTTTRTATTTKTVAKQPAQAPRTATRTAARTTSTVHHAAVRAVAKPRTIAQKPAAAAHVVAAAPAAHVMAAPSPVALTTTSTGGHDGHLLPLLAALGIALVALTRSVLRRTLRLH